MSQVVDAALGAGITLVMVAVCAAMAGGTAIHETPAFFAGLLLIAAGGAAARLLNW